MNYPPEFIAQILKKAFDETLNEHPEFEPYVGEFGNLVAEALITSPSFGWAYGNIWSDVDESVQN